MTSPSTRAKARCSSHNGSASAARVCCRPVCKCYQAALRRYHPLRTASTVESSDDAQGPHGLPPFCAAAEDAPQITNSQSQEKYPRAAFDQLCRCQLRASFARPKRAASTPKDAADEPPTSPAQPNPATGRSHWVTKSRPRPARAIRATKSPTVALGSRRAQVDWPRRTPMGQQLARDLRR